MGCGASNAATTSSEMAQQQRINNARAQPVATASIVHRPLSLPKPYTHGAPVTQGELNNQRTEFWTTRTDGNRLMWQAIRSSAEALLSEDIALANAILEASSISTPNGTLDLCYDERGTQYKVPVFCFNNPVELMRNLAPTNNIVVVAEPVEIVEESENPEDIKHHAKLRVRVNPGDHNINVHIDPKHSILQLKHVILKEITKTHPQLLPMEVERQRIMFLGKELSNNSKVGDAGFDDVKVVQVFMRPKPK